MKLIAALTAAFALAQGSTCTREIHSRRHIAHRRRRRRRELNAVALPSD
jgi:hypothetical protein